LNTFDAEIKKNVLDLGTFRTEFRPIPESDVEEYSVILNADSTDLNRLANELQEDFDK
jgi:hypothetical protein